MRKNNRRTNVLRDVENWHQTRVGLLTFCVAELALAYGFASWAIDSGRLSAWSLALILTIGAVRNLVRMFWKLVHGYKTAKA